MSTIWMEKDKGIDVDNIVRSKEILSIKELMKYRDELENHACDVQYQIDRINHLIQNKKIEDITPNGLYVEFMNSELIDIRFTIEEEIKVIDGDGQIHSVVDIIMSLGDPEVNSIDSLDITFFAIEEEEVIDPWYDGQFCNIDKEMLKRRCKEIFFQEVVKQSLKKSQEV